jgi:hypothetical protein
MVESLSVQAEIAPRGKSAVPPPSPKPCPDAPVGAVFTPRPWAVWLAATGGALDAWLSGATVLDPTCGRGDLLLGLLAGARRRGLPPRDWPVHRLCGIEREPAFLRQFVRQARTEFDVEWPRDRLICADFLQSAPNARADVLLGNPPWVNFADLPDRDKAALKPLFLRYGLAADRRGLLLGASRVDLAALVIAKAVADHLRPHGTAAFFLPMSLLFNDGAHAGFRRFRAGETTFALEAFFDLTDSGAFPGMATRYGAACFRRDAATRLPVPCVRGLPAAWRRSWAAPLTGPDGPFAVADTAAELERLRSVPRIAVAPGVKPRQGVNPCGASRVFFFDGLPDGLPRRYVYPLLDRVQFDDPAAPPRRWVLLPHDPATGRPLTAEQVAAEPSLKAYLDRHRPALESRRGRWLGSWIGRGQWWALLGVGPYCFAPYRVAWPAYGADRFTPRAFGRWDGQPWQGRQALHALVPCDSRDEAERLAEGLKRPEVEAYLRAFGTAGTRSWAQPGRVGRLLDGDGQSPPVATGGL